MTQQSKTNQAKDQIKDSTPHKDKPAPGKSAKEIEAEVGETRNAITTDIRELGDKFTAANVKETAKEAIAGVKDAAIEQAAEIKDVVVDKAIEVKDAVVDKATEMKDAVVEKATEVKDATVDKLNEAKDVVLETMDDVGEHAMRAGTATWRFTKANAVPLALVGVGAAWIVAKNRRGIGQELPIYRSNDNGIEAYEDDDDVYDRATRQRRAAAPSGRKQTTSRGRSKSSAGSASPTSARIATRARDVMDEASEGLERAEHAIAETASRGATYVQDTLRHAGTTSKEFVQANPMLVALAAVAAGVGIGMLIPSSEREDRLLAPSRAKFQHLIGDVRDAATDVAEMAKDTATESMKALT